MSVSKITAMTNINDALQHTSLNSAKIWNAFPSLAEGPTNGFSAKPEIDPKVPQLIPDAKTFADLSLNDKINFSGLAKNNKLLSHDEEREALTPLIFEQLRTRMKINYLKHGDESIKNFHSGVCTMFACVTLGYLARHPDLLEQGSVVELFNYTATQGGHAFVVVNRAGTAGDVDSWGNRCYTIDAWYARHRLTPPGSNPVKDMTGGTRFSNQAFNDFLKDAASRTVFVTFSHQDLIQAFN